MEAVTLKANTSILKAIVDFAQDLASKQNTQIIITNSAKALDNREEKRAEFFSFAGAFKGEFEGENSNTIRMKRFANDE